MDQTGSFVFSHRCRVGTCSIAGCRTDIPGATLHRSDQRSIRSAQSQLVHLGKTNALKLPYLTRGSGWQSFLGWGRRTAFIAFIGWLTPMSLRALACAAPLSRCETHSVGSKTGLLRGLWV